MAKRTQLQKVRDVRRIIDFVKEHGRITTEHAAKMTGISIKTARLDMQVAQRAGEIIHHGRQGLFRDHLAALDFDLMKYDCRSKGAKTIVKTHTAIAITKDSPQLKQLHETTTKWGFISIHEN